MVETALDNRRGTCVVESIFIKKGAPPVPHANSLGPTSKAKPSSAPVVEAPQVPHAQGLGATSETPTTSTSTPII